MRLAGAFVVLALLAGTAAAQPGMTPATAPAPPPPQPVMTDQLSEGTALALSVGGTIASWATLAVTANMSNPSDAVEALATVSAFGTLLAPNFGHWYARRIATRGLGARLVGVGVVFGAAALAFHECPLFATESCDRSGLPPVLAVAGAALFVAGTVDDFMTVGGAVRRYNQRSTNLALVPVMQRDGGGLLLTGAF